jgi:hypothetical protein
VNNNYLAIIAAALFAIGILTLLILLIRLAYIIYTSTDRSRQRSRKRVEYTHLMIVLSALVVVFAAQSIFWISGQLRNYQVVYPGKALCSLDLYTPADRLPRLIYSIVDEEGNELVEVFPVRDARVRLSGEIITWPPLFKRLGLGTFFKLTNVEFVRTDSISDTTEEFVTPIHQGSMPLFRRLSGWPGWLSIASTKTVKTPVFTADSTFSYDIYVSGDKLVLR